MESEECLGKSFEQECADWRALATAVQGAWEEPRRASRTTQRLMPSPLPPRPGILDMKFIITAVDNFTAAYRFMVLRLLEYFINLLFC